MRIESLHERCADRASRLQDPLQYASRGDQSEGRDVALRPRGRTDQWCCHGKAHGARGVPYFEVQLFGEVSRQLHHVLLSPEELRREGQAKDRFKFTMGQMCSKRDASLSCQNYTSLPQYTDIAELAKQLQSRLQNEQKVQEIALDARAAQAAIQQVSGSTLEEEDDIAASAASGGQAAVQAPRRLLRGRTTAQQPRRPAGLASTPASSQRTRSASSPTVTSQVLVANDGDGNITESPKDEKEAVELVMGGWNNGREMARVSGAGS